MPAETPKRKQSREVRDLKTQGQTALTWGLASQLSESSVVGVGLILRERLADRTKPGAAAEAAETAGQLLDKTLPKMAAAPNVACRQGCAYCCHSPVSVSAPEVFRLADAVRRRGQAEAVLSRIKARTGTSFEALTGKRLACPLLADNTCTAYEARPAACRETVSTSVEDCRAHFDGRRSTAPYVSAAANAGLIARSALLAAARSLELKVDTYELASALGVALETPDAEERWLAGENVLAAATKAPLSPNMVEATARWTVMLKKLAEE